MHRFPHGVVAAIRERDIGEATRCANPGATLFNFADRLNEIEGVTVVLLHARSDSEDIGVENDILGVDARFLGENFIGSFADSNLIGKGCCLTFFIESHHHHSSTVASAKFSLSDEFCFPFF